MELSALAAVAVAVAIAGFAVSFSFPRESQVRTGPVSPVDEAERILARRYASGRINSDEYNRMLQVLRR